MAAPQSSELNVLQMLLGPEPRNLQTTLEFYAGADGVLSGVDELLAFLVPLYKHRFQLWALDQGAPFARGEVILRLRGHFFQLVPHIQALTGILSASSGWATVARALVNAADPLPVVVSAARTRYPNLYVSLEAALVVGGCVGPDSPWQRGLIPRNLILLMEDTLRAAQAFDRTLPAEVPRMIRVGTYHDEADESVRVALALGDKLGGVVLETEPERNQVSSEQLTRVRDQLNLAGFPRVKIFVGGDVTPALVTAWKETQAPIDGLYAGDALAFAPPIPFTAELQERDGKPIARRGLVPGTTPNLRLKKIEPAYKDLK